MRDFSWRIFCATGEIDAYLLYKEHEVLYGFKEESAASRAEELADNE